MPCIKAIYPAGSKTLVPSSCPFHGIQYTSTATHIVAAAVCARIVRCVEAQHLVVVLKPPAGLGRGGADAGGEGLHLLALPLIPLRLLLEAWHMS